MTAIQWDASGKRYYETGIDRGVLYVGSQPGVPWNGLTSVTKNPSGGQAKPFYVDGIKYTNNHTTEEFEFTVTALTYPDEFEACDGSAEPRPGMFVSQQRRQSFGLAYRTKIGNEFGENSYKIHLVYNALAEPTTRGHKSHNDSIQVLEFMWKVTVLPAAITGYRPSANIVIDSRTTDPTVLSVIEGVLYGTDATNPRLPSFAEIVALYDDPTLIVKDNGDGTFSIEAPATMLSMIDDNTFEVTAPTVTFPDGNSFTISS